MRHTVILTRKAAYKKRVVGDGALVHRADVFPSVKLVIQVRAISKVLHIAVMRPLCFCAGLPLRKPYRVPT